MSAVSLVRRERESSGPGAVCAALLIAAALGTAPLPAQQPPGERGLDRSEPPTAPLADQSGNAGLFVGVNQFSDPTLTPLRFAVNDAIALAHAFVVELQLVPGDRAVLALSGAATGRAAEQLRTLRDTHKVRITEATNDAIFMSLTNIARLATRAEDLLVVAMSSHGFEADGVPYLMPQNGVKAALGGTAVSLKEIEKAVDGSAAGKRLLLIDACRERPLRDAKAAGASMGSAFWHELGKARGTALLASCNVGQFSYEDEDLQQGVFTHYLLEGLRGRAGSDVQGYIRLGSVCNYACEGVENWARRKARDPQRPWFKGAEVARNIPLAVEPAVADRVQQTLIKLDKLQKSGEITLAERDEARRLAAEPALSPAEAERLKVYLDLAAARVAVENARKLLARRARQVSPPRGESDADEETPPEPTDAQPKAATADSAEDSPVAEPKETGDDDKPKKKLNRRQYRQVREGVEFRITAMRLENRTLTIEMLVINASKQSIKLRASEALAVFGGAGQCKGALEIAGQRVFGMSPGNLEPQVEYGGKIVLTDIPLGATTLPALELPLSMNKKQTKLILRNIPFDE